MINTKKLEKIVNIIFIFLILIYVFFIIRFDFDIFISALKPNAGLEKAIKREKVLELNYLVKKYNLKSFNVDPELLDNPDGFSYRSIFTTTYPSRYNKKSKDFIVYNHNLQLFDNCDLIEKKSIVSAIKCM